MTTETVEEKETRKKQKQESEKPADFGILSEGSYVTENKKKGNSVGCIVASGSHCKKVKRAWWKCNMGTLETQVWVVRFKENALKYCKVQEKRKKDWVGTCRGECMKDSKQRENIKGKSSLPHVSQTEPQKVGSKRVSWTKNLKDWKPFSASALGEKVF